MEMAKKIYELASILNEDQNVSVCIGYEAFIRVFISNEKVFVDIVKLISPCTIEYENLSYSNYVKVIEKKLKEHNGSIIFDTSLIDDEEYEECENGPKTMTINAFGQKDNLLILIEEILKYYYNIGVELKRLDDDITKLISTEIQAS